MRLYSANNDTWMDHSWTVNGTNDLGDLIRRIAHSKLDLGV